MTRDINDLLPLVKTKALEFQAKAKQAGIDFIFTSVYRSVEEQNAIYAQGRTTPGSIVTNAKGGQSFHNWRVAFDIVPVIAGKAIWNDNALWAKLGQIGTSLGLEWGGSWVNFKDLPHFQFTAGYTFQNFIDKKVDFSKFGVVTNGVPAPKPILSEEMAAKFVSELNTKFAAKDYKGAKDSCSYLFTELVKLL